MAANLRVHHVRFGVMDSGRIPTLTAVQAGFHISETAESMGSPDPSAVEVNEADSGLLLHMWVNPLRADSPTKNEEGDHAY